MEDSQIDINQMNNDLIQEKQARVSLRGKLEEMSTNISCKCIFAGGFYLMVQNQYTL